MQHLQKIPIQKTIIQIMMWILKTVQNVMKGKPHHQIRDLLLVTLKEYKFSGERMLPFVIL